MSKRIGILGCGWLGTPLAQRLVRKGWHVRGSTTRAEKEAGLSEKGIEPFVIRLGELEIEGDITGFLKGLDCLVLNIPPGLRNNPGADFTARIRLLHAHLEKAGIPHLVFISSTSVYGDAQGKVTEKDPPVPDSETGRQLLQAESLILSGTRRTVQILRPGGLLGPGRHPVYSLSGRVLGSGGNSPVNLVRLGDLLNILEMLVAGRPESGIYNAVFPEHPTKEEFYTLEARSLDLPPPSYPGTPAAPQGKIVRSKALEELGYRFSHPIRSSNPEDGGRDSRTGN